MDAFQIEYVANATKLERFLLDLVAYLEGGERPRVFHGSAEHSQRERIIVQKISTLMEDLDRAKYQLRMATQAPYEPIDSDLKNSGYGRND